MTVPANRNPESDPVLRRKQEVARVTYDLIDAEVALQLEGFTDRDGNSYTTAEDLFPTYSRIKAERKPASEQTPLEIVAIRALDTLVAMSVGIDKELVLSADEAARLTNATLGDSYLPPSKMLSYLRGTSSRLPEKLSPHTLSGGLEVHTVINDEQLNAETTISLPAVIRSARKAGLLLSREDIAIDDEAIELILGGVVQYTFQHEVARATKKGIPYHSFHTVDTSGSTRTREDSVAEINAGEHKSTLLTRASWMAELLEFDVDNADFIEQQVLQSSDASGFSYTPYDGPDRPSSLDY